MCVLKKSKRFIKAIILTFGSRQKNLSGHIRSGPQPPPLLCLNGHMKNNVSFFSSYKSIYF